jgi:uncharacterized membrane protein
MKLKPTFTKILHNRLFINLIGILVIITVIGNLIHGNFHAVIFFALLAWLTSFFSKELMLVLLVPLIVVNIYTRMNPFKEGMNNNSNSKNSNSNSKNSNSKNSNSSDSSSKNLSDAEKINVMKNKNSSSSNDSLPITPMNHTTDESFQSNGQNKKKKYNVDYASTVEEAYDNLNNILGSDGINNLTKDTQKLMKQQMQLTQAMSNMQPLMESMGPLLQQASGLLGSMGGTDGVNGLANLANSFKIPNSK